MKHSEFIDCAVIFYVFNRKLTGSVINAFEYFLTMYEHNKDIKLVLLEAKDYQIEYFVSVMNNRYDLDDLEGYENNIISMSQRGLLWKRFGKALVLDYSTINKTRGLLVAKELIVISEKKTDERDYMYDKNLYNVTYYGEMPFHYKDKDYRMKLMLSRFKKLDTVEQAIYINSPHNNDKSFIPTLNIPEKPIIFKQRSHTNNLFECFDAYVYYHADKWFDPHPRLFIECTWYDKDIFYFNQFDIKDGSYYRYEDVVKYGTYDRILSKDDDIVRQFI